MPTRIPAITLALALAAGVATSPAYAQSQNRPSLSFDDLVKPTTAAQKDETPCGGFESEIKAACEKSIKAAWDHYRWKIEYTQKAYEAHHIYTMFVFILVCGLVLLGMWLSYREFERGARGKPAASEPQSGGKGAGPQDAAAGDAGAGAHPAPPTEEQKSTLEMGTSGVKVSSPVLGVIILVVSMGFFYLYLKTVYPIEEAQSPAAPQAAAQALPKTAEPPK
jgi:hypothetical protein